MHKYEGRLVTIIVPVDDLFLIVPHVLQWGKLVINRISRDKGFRDSYDIIIYIFSIAIL